MTLDGVEGLFTRALGERGAVDALGLGALTGGNETPPTNMVEVGVDIPSLELDITQLKGTPKPSELDWRNWTITRSFRSVRGGLKFLANSLVNKYSILLLIFLPN